MPLKNIIQSILHAHLIPGCPHTDMLGRSGRAWLAAQPLPDDERAAVARHVREIDRLSEDLKMVERDLAQTAMASPATQRLMTIPGVDMIVAHGLIAAIGDPARFATPQKLVSYLGLNPSVRQSGPGPAYHGRITKQGRGHARGMLVEAAGAAVRAPATTRTALQNTAPVSDIIPEWWAPSSRNDGRDQIGMAGVIIAEWWARSSRNPHC